MKTSLEECSKCAPGRGPGRGGIIPERKRKQGQVRLCLGTRTPAPPVRIAKMPSRMGQASREDSGSSLGYPPCSVAVRTFSPDCTATFTASVCIIIIPESVTRFYNSYFAIKLQTRIFSFSREDNNHVSTTGTLLT